MLKLAVELIAFQLGIGQIVALQLLQRVRVGGIHILFKLGLLLFTELIKAQRRGLLADDLLADHLILRLGLQLVKVNFRRLHAIHLVELLHLHFLVIQSVIGSHKGLLVNRLAVDLQDHLPGIHRRVLHHQGAAAEHQRQGQHEQEQGFLH